jgi:predicted nucleotidyltransferase
MKYGLIERDFVYINEAIREFPEIAEVILFGSRAKGNYKIGSDVDLAIKGDRITYEITARFADCLNEEKPLPYFFDVVHYEEISAPKLKEHIDRVGINIAISFGVADTEITTFVTRTSDRRNITTFSDLGLYNTRVKNAV